MLGYLAASHDPSAAPSHRGALETAPRALIVEDDADTRDVLQKALRALGFEVSCAATVFQGLRQLESFKPSHVLLDLRFPDGHGTEVLNLIRADNIPARVALLTASGPGDRLWNEAMAFNPEAAFRKPWDLTQIIAWLKQTPPQSPAPPSRPS